MEIKETKPKTQEFATKLAYEPLQFGFQVVRFEGRIRLYQHMETSQRV